MLANERPRAWIRLVVQVAVCQMLVAPMSAAAQTEACGFRSRAALVADTVQAFERERGRLPESVDELVTAGFLKVAPAGPDGRPLQIALRGDGNWAVTSSDGVIPPSRWACVTDHEIAGLAGVLLVAGSIVAFARTRRPVFLALAAIAVVVWFAWAAFTPLA